jgi:hypothetical protein
MKKNGRGTKESGNGAPGLRSLNTRFGRGRKNGFVHMASPATVSENEKAPGITKTQKAVVLRAFAAAGVKL